MSYTKTRYKPGMERRRRTMAVVPAPKKKKPNQRAIQKRLRGKVLKQRTR